MNEHQNLANYLVNLLSSNALTIPGPEVTNVVNAKGWLAAIVQGKLLVVEPPNIKKSETGESPLPIG